MKQQAVTTRRRPMAHHSLRRAKFAHVSRMRLSCDLAEPCMIFFDRRNYCADLEISTKIVSGSTREAVVGVAEKRELDV
jgi:hypothetical protein